MKVYIDEEGNWMVPVIINSKHALVCLSAQVENEGSINPWTDEEETFEELVENCTDGTWIDVQQFQKAKVTHSLTTVTL